jgi:hypothetical protein
MIDGTVLGSRPTYDIRLPLTVASFLIYALGVLALHQDRAPGWALEAAGAVPAAVSYVAYGTPFGAMDDNVISPARRKECSRHLATIATGSIPHGAVDMYSNGGTGAGTDVFTTAAMWLFGISLSSLV